MPIITAEFDATKPDATFDLDGTVFKFTVLEEYAHWLSQQGIFAPIPAEIPQAKQTWKDNNNEENYKAHLNLLVQFFIEQVTGKSVSTLHETANIVASQQAHRQWNITRAIMRHVQESHNVIAVSLMPEWLMEPFVRNLGFAALIGSTYVSEEGRYTDEAHTIDKAQAYSELSPGKATLDIHMGDTMGDRSLFDIASRPILFNPSWTLTSNAGHNRTIFKVEKDNLAVMNPYRGDNLVRLARLYGPPYDVEAILQQVIRHKAVEAKNS